MCPHVIVHTHAVSESLNVSHVLCPRVPRQMLTCPRWPRGKYTWSPHRSCGWRAGCWSWSYTESMQPQQRLIQSPARCPYIRLGTKLEGRVTLITADSRPP